MNYDHIVETYSPGGGKCSKSASNTPSEVSKNPFSAPKVGHNSMGSKTRYSHRGLTSGLLCEKSRSRATSGDLLTRLSASVARLHS